MADLDDRFVGRNSNQDLERVSQNLCDDAYGGFNGIDLGIVKLGTQNCSLVGGIDIGIARAGGSLGQRTGAGAEVGVPGARLGAGGGVSFDERAGIKAGAGAAGELGREIGSRVSVGAGIGPGGVESHAKGDAYVGPASVEAGAKAALNDKGLHGRARAGAELEGVVGAHGKVRADIGEKTGARGRQGAYIGPVSEHTDAGAYLSRKGVKTHAEGDIKVQGR